MIPDNTSPKVVMDRALQTQIDQLTANGQTQTDKWNAGATIRPSQGWNLDAFKSYLSENQAVTPPFIGAPQPQGGWLDQSKQLISGSEGFEDTAYHDVYSPLRGKGKEMYVKPGQFVEGAKDNNISIGFGWNLGKHPESRKVFQEQLGIDGSTFDKILQGQASISREQGEKLRDYAIYQFNADLDKQVKVPLKDHQRAALLSLMYNFGPTGFRNTGVPEALNSGKSPTEVAKIIQGLSGNQKALKGRRTIEANAFLGTALASQQVASTEINPQDRH